MEDFKPILDSMDNTFGAIDEPAENTTITITLDTDTIWEADAIGYNNDGKMLHTFDWIIFTEDNIEAVIEEFELPDDEHDMIREAIGETVLIERGIINIENVVSIESNVPKELSDNGPKVVV